MKMVSSELCAENLEAAVEFGKLMQYDGPWICAGDGTKAGTNSDSCFSVLTTLLNLSFVLFFQLQPNIRSQSRLMSLDRHFPCPKFCSQILKSSPELSPKLTLRKRLLRKSGSLQLRLVMTRASDCLLTCCSRFHFPTCLCSPSHLYQIKGG
jgi:hypothetical protein